MITGIYAVRDRSADCFMSPFVAQSDSVAIREFQQLCKDPSHPFAKWATDFSLYRLGSYNDNNGKLDSLVEPNFLVSAFGVESGKNGE